MNILLLLFLLQQPIPEPVDHSPDKTHKAKHERTEFYTKDGKLCGRIAEFKYGIWYAYFPGRQSQAFETRAEVVTFIKLSCPIQGAPGTMEAK